MIVVKAVEVASEYLKRYFPVVKNIRMEEFELTEDKEFWFITLSYTEQTSRDKSLQENTKFKIFKIENETFLVFSMKTKEFKSV